MATEIFEPTNQKEFLDTLAALDNDVQMASRDQHNLANTLRVKRHALEVAAQDWEAGDVHRTPQQDLKDVMRTQQMVASGELPVKIEEARQILCEIDRVAYYSQGGNQRNGGGNAFRRGATTTQHPKPIKAPQPMHADGAVSREGVVPK